MALLEVLARGRAMAEARMLSRVTVHRSTGRSGQDETTGRETQLTQPVATGVPFRVDGASTGDGGTRVITINGVEFQQATAVGHLPILYLNLRDGDVLEVTAGECAGARYRVVEAVRADQKTARRVPIVEV